MEIFALCVCGWQLCTEALLINKQVLFDFITLSRAFLGSCAFTMNIYASKWECGTQVARGRQPGSQAAQKQQQLSTDAPVAQNSNRVELLGLSMGRREEGKGLGGSTHSQPVVLPLILLTRSSFYATQPVAQVAPVPHYPSLFPSLSSLLPLPCPSACADGNQSATAGALASHLAPDFWLNVTTAAASPDAF